ncbi:MAG: hypothetical protein NPIRA05_00670 [Nitrospirales bacterium]|nr:MAG: hypothetical protein NPIRA05_00670 [Nitrospirales bacterium]
MISERLDHNTITINIHGAFDAETAQEFSFTARRAYRMGFRNFYVSLKHVTMIDKAGLTLLSNILRKLQQRGCTGTIIHSLFSAQTEFRHPQEKSIRPALRRTHANPTVVSSSTNLTMLGAV